MAKAFVLKEPDGERRVAATPDSVKRLAAAGLKVMVESGAGVGAHYADATYVEAGAEIADNREQALAEADVVLGLNVADIETAKAIREGASLVSFLWAFDNLELIRTLNARRISAFAMDAIPRITRAQKDDALSSQANLAGYKAVIAAAWHLDKLLPMLMTAAGTIRPARFVVIGVGVAGLQAIATAKRLGAIVEATDPRPETKEQTESLGAKFLEVAGVEVKEGEGGYAAEQTEEYKQAQAEMLAKAFANADAIITTALIPYRPAPITITAEHVKSMRPGSVIVDLAAERGGNCELTEPGRTVEKHGVLIAGELNWPGTVSVNASDVYARNVQNVLTDVIKDGELAWDMQDEIVAGAMICHAGEVTHAKVRDALGLPPLEPKQDTTPEPEPAPENAVENAAENTADESDAEPETPKEEPQGDTP
jgi:H+-translocating NAD(P) transhydrogenase subunit alpha